MAQKKLKALTTIVVGTEPDRDAQARIVRRHTKTYKRGEEFSVDAETADRLIESGRAVASKDFDEDAETDAADEARRAGLPPPGVVVSDASKVQHVDADEKAKDPAAQSSVKGTPGAKR
jgi:hypothetical protein